MAGAKHSEIVAQTLLDARLNDFAIRSFRDIADGDYIAARMASRSQLVTQYLWASQQAIEKYLKCILLLNRIPATSVKHDLGAALSKIASSGKLTIDLKRPTKKFIDYLDTYGRFRYLETPHHAFGYDIITLDRSAWELRRYCELSGVARSATLREGYPAPKVRIPRGFVEEVIDNPKHAAREPLLWMNAFFGKRIRKTVRTAGWFSSVNSPLSLHPEILDEVLKYVYLPGEVVVADGGTKKRKKVVLEA